MVNSTLDYLITSKAKRSLLKLFYANPQREFYLREIARLTSEPLSAVQRELGYLEKAGLVTSRRAGNLKYYSVVKESPLYPELKKIVYATIGLGDYLKGKFQGSGQIELAFVYGSVASNEETSRSDIDLFIVGGIGEEALHEAVAEIEKDIGRTVNYTLMDRREFRKRLKEKEPFVTRVMAGKKLVLKGDPDVY